MTIVPTKTRIGFQRRMIFAAASIRKNWLNAHIVLARRLENPRFSKIESYSPKNHVHYFRIQTLKELNGEFLDWIKEAYEVGEQEHLKKNDN